jgi:hypothetical protein
MATLVGRANARRAARSSWRDVITGQVSPRVYRSVAVSCGCSSVTAIAGAPRRVCSGPLADSPSARDVSTLIAGWSLCYSADERAEYDVSDHNAKGSSTSCSTKYGVSFNGDSMNCSGKRTSFDMLCARLAAMSAQRGLPLAARRRDAPVAPPRRRPHAHLAPHAPRPRTDQGQRRRRRTLGRRTLAVRPVSPSAGRVVGRKPRSWTRSLAATR